MLKKTMLAALAVALALGALASPALATVDPEIELPEKHSFTVSGGATSLETKSNKVSCTSVTGSGEFENSTTGTIQIRYQGCKLLGIFNCTTSGQSTGNITTTTLQLHLKPVTEGKAAVLITPKEGHVATFKCFTTTVEVKGNGLIGVITAPEYEKESSTVTIAFSGEGGTQSDMTVEGEGTAYDLTATIGGTTETADVSGEAKMEFEGQVKLVRPALAVAVVNTGTVTSTPAGIDCTTTCAVVFNKGTKVTLEAKDAKNFKGWDTIGAGKPGTCTGVTNPCVVTLDADLSLEATF